MKDINRILSIIGQIIAYILAVIIIIQILRIIFGGSWSLEEIVLALVIFNLTMTFGIGVYLINMHITLNNKISDVNTKLHGHFEWHRGKDKN